MLEEIAPQALARSIRFNTDAEDVVREIIDAVRTEREEAVIRYTKRFDAREAGNDFSLVIDRDEIETHTTFPDETILRVMHEAKENIARFHREERERSFYTTEGDVFLGQSVIPLDRVAVYVPGGKAFYPSTLLMTVMPAKVAGVKEVVIVTPPDVHGNVREEILYFANVLGVSQIVTAGGAQGVAYAAFGSDTFKPVDKIVGPGNVYVTLAKKHVFGYCDIDMLAGPSEIMVVADESADAKFIARDLLSQAEHDEDASSILVTTSRALLEEVGKHVRAFTDASPRKEIITKSLTQNGKAAVVETIEDALAIANAYGPEHLEVVTALPDAEVIRRVRNAGALFLGAYTPEPLGDYYIGSNHVLPTYGSSRFSSPLGVYDFYRRVNVISAGASYLKRVGEDVVAFAEYEGLTAHADAVRERLSRN